MNRFKVYTFGEVITINADHFTVNKETGIIEFYKSDTAKDERWTVFLHGVSAIESLGRQMPETPAVAGRRIL